MRRFAPLLALVLSAAPLAATPALAGETASADIGMLLRADRWSDAQVAAAQYADPVATKLITYYRMLAPNAASAEEIAAFIAANPDWPLQSLLARHRDEALVAMPDDSEAATFCRAHPPALADAMLRCAEAFSHTGAAAEAGNAAREAWRDGLVGASLEASVMREWGSVLSADDQRARFDRLAWTNTDAAARQIARLAAKDRAPAEARVALRRNDPSALDLLAALPADVQTQPGLFLEHARYLRRANREDDALALWKAGGPQAERAAPPDHLRAFWIERSIVARDRLRDGDAAGAYALVSGHTQGAEEQEAEADFLAGFIALRGLHQPALAEPHFRALLSLGRAALTVSRAHYWLARTAAARGDSAAAHAEYMAAAAWPTTYYGQLAAIALGDTPEMLSDRILAVRGPAFTPAQVLDMAAREVARAATMLVTWGETQRARAFLLRLDQLAPDDSGRALAARLALGFGVVDPGVMIARHAGRDGIVLPDTGWPMPVSISETAIPPSIALGIIRQESSFDPDAVSPAGARGLMQLMPSTAEREAKTLALSFSTSALTADPAYNIRLGSVYFRGLLDRFGGALPLAIAAYNAGPNRVDKWLADNGDPRTGKPDGIDWIELIPFGETRNYVQRVIENIMIYRAKRHESLPDPALRYAAE